MIQFVDFELAVVNVVREIFPTSVISFCLFHLTKNAYDHLGKNHLRCLYADREVKALLRCLPALALLPPDEISDGFYQVYAALQVCVYVGIIAADHAGELTGKVY